MDDASRRREKATQDHHQYNETLNTSWITPVEQAQHQSHDQAEWEANQALIAAWLRGDFDEEIRYLNSPYNIQSIKNSLTNMTRRMQAVEYAEDLCPKTQEHTVELENDWEILRIRMRGRCRR